MPVYSGDVDGFRMVSGLLPADESFWVKLKLKIGFDKWNTNGHDWLYSPGAIIWDRRESAYFQYVGEEDGWRCCKGMGVAERLPNKPKNAYRLLKIDGHVVQNDGYVLSGHIMVDNWSFLPHITPNRVP